MAKSAAPGRGEVLADPEAMRINVAWHSQACHHVCRGGSGLLNVVAAWNRPLRDREAEVPDVSVGELRGRRSTCDASPLYQACVA